MKALACVICPFIFLSCSNSGNQEQIQSSSENIFTAMIEIPAGTNHKIEFDKDLGEFKVDRKNGKERVIKFLPYPGNYGYVPDTEMDVDEGGDGDAVDVLIICESLPTGTLIEFVPIAMLKLIDEGELDYKILGVPLNSEMNVLKVTSYAEISEQCPECLNLVEQWFLNYDDDIMVSQGWATDNEAIKEIRKWTLPE